MQDSPGIITTTTSEGERIDYLYRISLKAIIYNEQGQLLVTNEAGRGLHLPGGGMEYGETIEETLKRELHEELGYVGNIQYRIIGAEPMEMRTVRVCQMWIVAYIELENYDFSNAPSLDDVHFIDPDDLATLDRHDAILSYKFHLIAKNQTI